MTKQTILLKICGRMKIFVNWKKENEGRKGNVKEGRKENLLSHYSLITINKLMRRQENSGRKTLISALAYGNM